MPVTLLSDLQMWQLLIAFFMPLIVAVINDATTPAAWKTVTALGVFSCASLITLWLQGGLVGSAAHVVLSVIYSAITGYTSYHNFWKPLGVTDYLESKVNLPVP